MKKIFRMANAELSKIFMRPSMFVLTAILVLALIFSFFFFSPEQVNTKYTSSQVNTININLEFQEKYKEWENEIVSEKTYIENYLADTEGTYEKFSNDFHSLCTYFSGDFYEIIIDVTGSGNDNYLSSSNYAKCETAFNTLKAKTDNLLIYMYDNISDGKINFVITQSFYDEVYSTLKAFYENLPSSSDLKSFSTEMVKDRYNTLKSTYNLQELDVKINKLEKIEIDTTKLESFLNEYYYSNITEKDSGFETVYIYKNKLKTLYDDVENYYNLNVDTTQEDIVAELIERIAKFRDYVQVCKTLISNNFELLRIGNKSDDQIATYVGFSGVSRYNLTKEITTYKYYFENDTFGYEYLTAFNFNKNSGTETNAYDFCFYSMQILSLFIIVFVIYFATSALCGEQSSGTLKMTATRPFTRNKIFSGKFLACFNVALILLCVSLISSLAIGFAFYGFSFQKVLIVMNADTLFITNPVVVLLIYFASILFDVIFYIALAILISMIFKNTTISTGITNAIFLVSVVMLGTSTSSWIRFVPSLNLQLYKFFTSSNTGLLSFSVVPNTSLITCGCMAVVFTLVIDIFARFLFTHRSIDK